MAEMYLFIYINSVQNNKFLDSSKLKEYADDNFKFEGNGKKFSKRVEDTAGKGEMVCSKQFLLFPQCFQDLLTAAVAYWLECPPREGEVGGSVPSRNRTKSFKLVVVAFPLGA